MECHIGVISGDGIGPEIVAEAKKVLDKGRGEIRTFVYVSGYSDGRMFDRCDRRAAYR